MSEQITHTMVLRGTHVSGAEEWYCPQCGRRFIMQWPPNYKRVILEAGDEYAYHTASKGGLQFGRVALTPHGNRTDENDASDQTEDGLEVWSEWADQLDFGDDADTDAPVQPNQ